MNDLSIISHLFLKKSRFLKSLCFLSHFFILKKIEIYLKEA